MQQDLNLIALANDFYDFLVADTSLIRRLYHQDLNYTTVSCMIDDVFLTNAESAMCYALSDLYGTNSITEDHVATIARLIKRYGSETLATYSHTVFHTLGELSKKFLYWRNHDTLDGWNYSKNNLSSAIKLLKEEKKIAQIGQGWGKGVFVFSSGPIEVEDEELNEELKSNRLEKILQAKEAEILDKNRQIENLTQAVANQTAMNWT